MIVKAQTHHVVDLALVPISRRPDVRDGVDRRIILRNQQLQPQMNRRGHGVELIDNRKARFFAKIVHARNVEEVIERKFVARQLRNLTQIFARYQESGFPAKLRLGEDSLSEELADAKRNVPLRSCEDFVALFEHLPLLIEERMFPGDLLLQFHQPIE